MSGRGGRASRQKGDRFERKIVRLLQDHAFGAERVPLSGSAGGSYKGDFTMPLLGRDLTIEAKARASGFAKLYDWLVERDALVIQADRRPPLVVLPLTLAIEIAEAAERGRIPHARDQWRADLPKRYEADTMREDPVGERPEPYRDRGGL